MNWLFFAIASMLLMGLVLFLVKLLSFGINPLLLLFYQYAGALAALTVYILIKRINLRVSGKNLFKILLSGFFVSTGLSFYYKAISLANASRVVPIHNIGITVLPSLAGFIILKEKSDKKIFLGLVFFVLSILLLTL